MVGVCPRRGAQACSLPADTSTHLVPLPSSAPCASLSWTHKGTASHVHSTSQFTKKLSLISFALPETRLGGLTLPFYGSELGIEVGDIYQGLATTHIGELLKPSSFLLGCRPNGPHTALPPGYAAQIWYCLPASQTREAACVVEQLDLHPTSLGSTGFVASPFP